MASVRLNIIISIPIRAASLLYNSSNMAILYSVLSDTYWVKYNL